MLHWDLQEKAWSLTATLDHPDQHTRTEQLMAAGSHSSCSQTPSKCLSYPGYKHQQQQTNSARSWDKFLISQLCRLTAWRLLTRQWQERESLWSSRSCLSWGFIKAFQGWKSESWARISQEKMRRLSFQHRAAWCNKWVFTLFLFFFEWICIINSESIFHSTCKASCGKKHTYIHIYSICQVHSTRKQEPEG